MFAKGDVDVDGGGGHVIKSVAQNNAKTIIDIRAIASNFGFKSGL